MNFTDMKVHPRFADNLYQKIVREHDAGVARAYNTVLWFMYGRRLS